MDADQLRDTARAVWRRTRATGLVGLHLKVPPDHIDRLEHGARDAGMTVAHYARAVLDQHLPQRQQPA